MFNQYTLLDIRIRGAGPDSYIVDVHSYLGGDARGTLVSPSADPAYQQLAERLQRLEASEDDLAALGQILFDSLFKGSIRDVYVRCQASLAQDEGLRLRFEIDRGLAEIAALPWEFLYDPDMGPLVLLDSPIVRYLPEAAAIPPLATTLPLKVLVTAAATAPAEEVERELAEVRAELSELEAQGYLAIHVENHLTLSTFQRRLRDGYQIWHFIGHGGMSGDGESGTLLLEDSDGSSTPVTASMLNILLNRSGVRLVVLDACGGSQLQLGPFRSIAPRLTRAQTPAVIATQMTVPQEATRAFAGEFYRALAEGFPVDACITEGRKAVLGATGLRNPDWGFPLVYTRVPDARLFELPAISQLSSGVQTPAQSGAITINIGSSNFQGSSISGSDAGSMITSAGDQRAEEIERLHELIHTLRRRLLLRHQQAARYGITADPVIAFEIVDIKQRIDEYSKQIQAMGG